MDSVVPGKSKFIHVNEILDKLKWPSNSRLGRFCQELGEPDRIGWSLEFPKK